MDDMWTRIADNLVARVSGPMKFRLLLQPAMAAFFAIRSGLADARAGRPPYFWTALTNSSERAALFEDGWRSVGKVFVLAIVLDVVYQVIVERFIYPGEAIIVAFVLAIVPYLVLRGLTTRLARAKNKKSVGIGAGIGGLVVLLLIGASMLIPVNSFRSVIEGRASAALGRAVTLGPLHLSMWRRAISADTVTVADDPAFSASPFLTAKSVRVGIELIPLLVSRSLRVTNIRFDHPEVTLIRNAAGRWNYASLGSPGSATGASGAIFIRNLELKDGRMVVGPMGRQHIYDRVNVSASDVSPLSASPVIASAALPGGGTFSLVGSVGPIDRSDASRTPLDAMIAFDRLNLATTGFLNTSAGLGGMLDLKARMTSMNGDATIVGNGIISKALFVSGGSPSSQPALVDFRATYDLAKHAGTLQPSTVTIGGAAARLDGTFDARGETTAINMRVTGARMPARELESFLPALGVHLPQGAHLASGTLVTNLTVAGPIGGLVATGTAGVSNARLTGFNLGSKMRAISAFTGLNTGGDLDINSLTANVRIAADGVRVDHLTADVPPLGHVAGAGTIDAKNNLDFVMVATLPGSSGGDSGRAVGTSGAAGIVNDVLGSLTGGLGKHAQVPRALATPSSYLAGGRIPFRVQGPMSNPQVTADVGGAAIHALEGELGTFLPR